MNELKKGLSISMKGPAAAAAIRRFKDQLAGWGLEMPKVPPLVEDFGLHRYESIGLIEYWIANEAKAGYCGKYLFVFDGQTCPLHKHRVKHETFFIVKGKVRMESGGRRWVMKPGDTFPVPRGAYHSFTGIGPALLLEVSTPCAIADNYFMDAAIPIGGNHKP
jgi:mannose-6-phosphate isomerase-like protein (cupin superfamily)